MADANHSDRGAGSAAGDALGRLRAQVLARWRAFPEARRDALDALLADALAHAAAADPEVLTVMDPVARPQRLRLATVVAEADLDSFYHNEWAELAVSHDGRLFLVYRRATAGTTRSRGRRRPRSRRRSCRRCRTCSRPRCSRATVRKADTMRPGDIRSPAPDHAPVTPSTVRADGSNDATAWGTGGMCPAGFRRSEPRALRRPRHSRHGPAVRTMRRGGPAV